MTIYFPEIQVAAYFEDPIDRMVRAITLSSYKRAIYTGHSWGVDTMRPEVIKALGTLFTHRKFTSGTFWFRIWDECARVSSLNENTLF